MELVKIDISWPILPSAIENAVSLYDFSGRVISDLEDLLTAYTEDTPLTRTIETLFTVRMAGLPLFITAHESGHLFTNYHQTGNLGSMTVNPFQTLFGRGRVDYDEYPDDLNLNIISTVAGINAGLLFTDSLFTKGISGRWEKERLHHIYGLHFLTSWHTASYYLRSVFNDAVTRRGMPNLVREDTNCHPSECSGSVIFTQKQSKGVGADDIGRYLELLARRYGQKIEMTGSRGSTPQAAITKSSIYNFEDQFIVGALLSIFNPASIFSLYKTIEYIETGETDSDIPYGLPSYIIRPHITGPTHNIDIFLPSEKVIFIPRLSFGWGYKFHLAAGFKALNLDITSGLIADLDAEIWKQGNTYGLYGSVKFIYNLGFVTLSGKIMGKSEGYHPYFPDLQPDLGLLLGLEINPW